MRVAATVALAVLRLVCGCVISSVLACGNSQTDASGTESTPVAECAVTAPECCPSPPVTYSDVAATFQSKCVSCHYSVPGGPWPLQTYEDAADWQGVIRDYLLDCSMPPPDSGVTLTDAERLAILTWVRCGGIE